MGKKTGGLEIEARADYTRPLQSFFSLGEPFGTDNQV
jgi:hypothetical protein